MYIIILYTEGWGLIFSNTVQGLDLVTCVEHYLTSLYP